MRRISLRRRSNELRKARALTLNAAVSGTFLQWFRSVLLATIPLDLQREGLSLSSLQASLRGRWRGNCHPGEPARAGIGSQIGGLYPPTRASGVVDQGKN